MVDNNRYIPSAAAAKGDAKLGRWKSMYCVAIFPLFRSARKLRGQQGMPSGVSATHRCRSTIIT